MQLKKIILHLFIILLIPLNVSGQAKSDKDFQKKLNEMYKRINKSIELIREQIVQNQSAPYLANLYMELADYLSQKSNVMYYLKMEALKGDAGSGDDKNKKFNDVVEVTKEATAVYEKIIAEFPKFKGRARAYYSLAVSYKSIDERISFLKTAATLTKKHPNTPEATKVQVLIGQDQFDNGILDDSEKTFIPISKSKYVYERNVAKYKLGLIKIATDKPKDALRYFEEVVTDKELKDEDKEKEVSFDSRSIKSSLKREALIDSIRAYTEVFKKNAKPVKYYSRIAPSEQMFTEVIEKLAYRYIQKKKYNEAVGLLRTLSEREPLPEKVLNIYKEVLLMIPLDKRVFVPVSEIRYVLERYLQFKNYFKIKSKVKKSMRDFFEKQLRDLGTRSHDKGKVTKGKMKSYHLKKAVEFYDLYLASFKTNKNAPKLAMNLGDTYFRMNDYINCGDYYLRAFKREFGEIKFRKEVIKNAIYCLQKDKEYSFYELRRVNGLLIEGLKLYMKFDPKKKKDAKTNFALTKAYYDQGYYDKALGKLISFMRKFPSTKYATDAANLILDYYNVKSDFEGIIKASDRILAMNLPNSDLNAKVKKIKEQAKYKKLQSKVQSSANFDGVATGKSYLSQAASIGDSELRNLALKKALEASKQEKDFKTFFKSARIIASKEKSAKKKFEIQSSIAQEQIKMTNYSQALSEYRKILGSSKYSSSDKKDAFNQSLTIALAIRDWNQVASLFRMRKYASQIPDDYKTQIRERLAGLFESPVKVPSSILGILRTIGGSPELALGIYKASDRVSSGIRSYGDKLTRSYCNSQSAAVCKWKLLEKLERKKRSFQSKIKKTSPKIQAVEKLANTFQSLTTEYTSLEGGDDAQVDIVSSLAQSEIYNAFASFLSKVANKNPSLKPVLQGKANESKSNAKNFLKRCSKIVEMSKLITPSNKYCKKGKYSSFRKLAFWTKSSSMTNASKTSEGFEVGIKKKLFSKFAASELEEIANIYLKKSKPHLAAAAATYAQSLPGANTGMINTILGCSLGKMKLLNEASYYLSKGDALGSLKSRCLGALK